ncbi:MAG: succinate dehydrogenase cytochrome b subunit [Cytophagaceae bacterium]|jgi:succinate dehydrogenase / fumarate reductase cytochrome b subunit|nr:succinate dehydrogenase cytochrome b subunit [Cytophagaceae bacterium]
MSWFVKTIWSTSVGRKLVMALTGLFLCTFLAVHLAGNLQLLKQDEGYAFNKYAVFMTSNPLIKTTSYLLYASIIGHAVWGIVLTIKNKKARPQGYAYQNESVSSVWASRNMGILGTILLVFIVAHMGDFWREYHEYGTSTPMETKTYIDEKGETVVYKDLYHEVVETYENIWMVLFYVASMVAVGFHLCHGFKSGFQTLGVNHPKYLPVINSVAFIFWGIIPAGFALIPLYIYFNHI